MGQSLTEAELSTSLVQPLAVAYTGHLGLCDLQLCHCLCSGKAQTPLAQAVHDHLGDKPHTHKFLLFQRVRAQGLKSHTGPYKSRVRGQKSYRVLLGVGSQGEWVRGSLRVRGEGTRRL